MSHWAFDLIGKPWEPGARGPHAFDCLGLVMWCTQSRLGVELPEIAQVIDSGWRKVEGPLQEDDVVLMKGYDGRHIGYGVLAGDRLGMLHADGCLTTKGPVGCVVFQSLENATAGGYHDFEIWRLGGAQ